MTESLHQGLRNLLSAHVQRANHEQLLEMVEGVIEAERWSPASETNRAAARAAEAEPAARFTRLADDGTPLVCSKVAHVAVHDAKTGLVWTADVLGEKDWADAKQLAGECRLLGKDDWRLPTVQELLSIVDYERYDPAVDPAFFRGPYGWTWSSTPAKHPSGYAWLVGLSGGYSNRGDVDLHGLVRAVRAGQSLGL